MRKVEEAWEYRRTLLNGREWRCAVGRAGRLSKPDIPYKMHRALNDALHQLHLVAKSPSLTTMVKGLKDVPGASRTTIYNAFSSQRLPMSGVVDALVVYLAERVRNVSPAQVDAVSSHFDNLWCLAEAEARSRATSTHAPPRSEPEEPAEAVVLSVPLLDAPRQRLALEPVRLRSRLDSLREAFGDAEVDEAVIAGVAEAISALPGQYGGDRTGTMSVRRTPGATGFHGDSEAIAES
ncbi:hypothetical protein AB0L26_08820 [Streptomyces nondiastaticus]|uniref:hypothetical protein n=1 Tax=Streptomyces nondiastaticus TaxID=3154512 RepID=UPI00341A1236